MVRYIHNNPLRTGLVNKPEQYQWSSHRAYLHKETVTELGEYFQRDPTAMSRAAGRLRERLANDRALTARLKKVKSSLKGMSECQAWYLTPEELKEKFRLGAVVFAAADVEVDKFLARLPAISDFADQVVITVTDDDNALKAAKRFMHGAVRAGTSEAERIEEDFILNSNMANVEIIDVSRGKEIRGFDITGHHYWYRHPWMSSDIIFLMRTNLPPHRRGLSPTELEGIWYLAEDYPEKIQEAAEIELKGQW